MRNEGRFDKVEMMLNLAQKRSDRNGEQGKVRIRRVGSGLGKRIKMEEWNGRDSTG